MKTEPIFNKKTREEFLEECKKVFSDGGYKPKLLPAVPPPGFPTIDSKKDEVNFYNPPGENLYPRFWENWQEHHAEITRPIYIPTHYDEEKNKWFGTMYYPERGEKAEDNLYSKLVKQTIYENPKNPDLRYGTIHGYDPQL